MFVELASAIEELSIPLDDRAMRTALALSDRLSAKVAVAVGEFDRAGLWDLTGAIADAAFKAADSGDLSVPAAQRRCQSFADMVVAAGRPDRPVQPGAAVPAPPPPDPRVCCAPTDVITPVPAPFHVPGRTPNAAGRAFGERLALWTSPESALSTTLSTQETKRGE